MKASDILTEPFLEKFKKLTAQEQAQLIEQLEDIKKPVHRGDTEPDLKGGAAEWV